MRAEALGVGEGFFGVIGAAGFLQGQAEVGVHVGVIGGQGDGAGVGVAGFRVAVKIEVGGSEIAWAFRLLGLVARTF